MVFAPPHEQMYPGAAARHGATRARWASVLEGTFRPGFFEGVLTVVLKLFNLVAPDVAVFGEKDAQQLALVRRMVADLNLPVAIEAVGTVRDPDGLAISSRNRYLSPAERATALALSRALRGRLAARGRRAAAAVLAAAQGRAVGSRHGRSAARRPTTWPWPIRRRSRRAGPAFAGRPLLLVAATVGKTRLIDNMAVRARIRPRESTRDRAAALLAPRARLGQARRRRRRRLWHRRA